MSKIKIVAGMEITALAAKALREAGAEVVMSDGTSVRTKPLRVQDDVRAEAELAPRYDGPRKSKAHKKQRAARIAALQNGAFNKKR